MVFGVAIISPGKNWIKYFQHIYWGEFGILDQDKVHSSCWPVLDFLFLVKRHCLGIGIKCMVRIPKGASTKKLINACRPSEYEIIDMSMTLDGMKLIRVEQLNPCCLLNAAISLKHW